LHNDDKNAMHNFFNVLPMEGPVGRLTVANLE